MDGEMSNTTKSTIEYWCAYSHNYALRQGFWEARAKNEHIVLQLAKLGLIASEVGEATEAVRMDNKDNLAEECADIAIRLFDFCEAYGIDLEASIRCKMKKNELRPKMHGKNS